MYMEELFLHKQFILVSHRKINLYPTNYTDGKKLGFELFQVGTLYSPSSSGSPQILQTHQSQLHLNWNYCVVIQMRDWTPNRQSSRVLQYLKHLHLWQMSSCYFIWSIAKPTFLENTKIWLGKLVALASYRVLMPSKIYLLLWSW